jgi:hypothetical protein
MDYLPEFGTDELQRDPTGVRARLLPGAGGRWVNKVKDRHYAYLTLEKPEGYEVERVSYHQFAALIGEFEQRVGWGETFEVTYRGEPWFYLTLTTSNEVAEADRRVRWESRRREGTEVRTRVREMRPLETVARPA